MSKRKKEQQWDEYLKGDSELSDLYKESASVEPPVNIDESILSASRKAVETKPGGGYSPFTRKYYVPLSLAAVLVLCVSIVFNIYKEESRETVTIPGPVMDYQQDLSVSDYELERSDPEEQINDEVKTQGNELRRGNQTTSAQSKPEESIISTESPDFPTPAEHKTGNYHSDPTKVEIIWQNKQLEKQKNATPVTENEPEPRSLLEPDEDIPAASRLILPREENLILKEDFDYKEAIEKDRDINGQMAETGTYAVGESGDERLSAETWLEHIKSLWESGEIDKAREQFNLFRQHNPGYEQVDLENYFSKETVEQLGRQ